MAAPCGKIAFLIHIPGKGGAAAEAGTFWEVVCLYACLHAPVHLQEGLPEGELLG